MLNWEELQAYKMYFFLLPERYPTIIHLKGLTVTRILPTFCKNFVKNNNDLMPLLIHKMLLGLHSLRKQLAFREVAT